MTEWNIHNLHIDSIQNVYIVQMNNFSGIPMFMNPYLHVFLVRQTDLRQHNRGVVFWVFFLSLSAAFGGHLSTPIANLSE